MAFPESTYESNKPKGGFCHKKGEKARGCRCKKGVELGLAKVFCTHGFSALPTDLVLVFLCLIDCRAAKGLQTVDLQGQLDCISDLLVLSSPQTKAGAHCVTRRISTVARSISSKKGSAASPE
jgi:hypothetical protein